MTSVENVSSFVKKFNKQNITDTTTYYNEVTCRDIFSCSDKAIDTASLSLRTRTVNTLIHLLNHAFSMMASLGQLQA